VLHANAVLSLMAVPVTKSTRKPSWRCQTCAT